MDAILGVLFAIFVGTLIIPKFAEYQKASNDNARAASTAQQQKQLNAAATTYIQQNSVAIQAIATPTTPAVITVAMLQASGVDLLPAAFSATNPYGQTWQVQVLEPTLGNLQALAMSITTAGETLLIDKQATKVATIVGASGGFIPQNDSGIYAGGAANAYGAYSGWTISTSGYTSVAGGHLAALLTFNNGQLQSNYLYRNAVPGQPQLNQMNTPLVMAAVQTTGTACTTTGAMARDSGGAIISCQSGIWKSMGDGKCVATSADLNILHDDGRCYNSAGNANSPAGADWFFLEVYRHTNPNNYYTAQRVVGMTGASAGRVWQRNQQSATSGTGWGAWVQQADDKVNISSVPGEGGVLRLTGSNGVMMHLENLNGTLRLLNSPWNAQLLTLDQNGNMTLGKGDVYTGYLTPGWAVETWGCPSTGAIAKAAYTVSAGWAWDGTLLSCQSGVWKKAQGGGGAGVTGILAPLKNKTISCRSVSKYGFVAYHYAMVDSNGYPYVRAYAPGWANGDSGWVLGFYASAYYINGGGTTWVSTAMSEFSVSGSHREDDGTSTACWAAWPWT